LEESFYSALDVKQLDWANVFLKVLIKKFPQSPKMMRMLGMLHEALQDHDKARDIYTELLTINSNDTLTLKRLVALERDNDRSNEAINLLNKYLEINM
jgi:TolA-binding protein